MNRMTDRAHPKEKIGSRYKYIATGEVMTLEHNDYSSCPFFRDSDGIKRCHHWEDFYKLPNKVLIGGELV